MKGIVAITAALASSLPALAADPQVSPAPVGSTASAPVAPAPVASAASSPAAAIPSGSASVPQPDAFTTPEWIAAYAKAKTYLKKFKTLNQKVALATGVGWTNGPCVGNTPAIPEVGFPGQCLEDSPLGVRFADNVSAFPAAVNVATTFNRDLFRKRGAAMGAEHRAKGVNIQLGPMMNMGRVAAGGRNWEGFGADPFLTGEAAYETIVGIQSQGVQACAKHYIDNEQEHFRDTSSSDVDDRTQHEVYAHPFLRSIQANVASVMCSYNRVNGTYACENDKTLNGILKQELGFKGYVMSDWQATHSTMSVVTGLDMTMPGDVTFNSGTTYFGDVLVEYVNNGTIPASRIDDMATRILAGWFLVGQDKNYPATNFDAWTPSKGQHVNAQGDHASLIRQIGAEGTVLLKNSGALPLNKPKSIAIIGNDGGPSSKGPNGYSDRGGNDGILAMGWGSGTADFPYLIDPLSAITKRSSKDNSTIASSLSDSDLAAAAAAATGKDVAIVFISADSGEGYLTVEGNFGDRNDLKAWHNGDALVAAVAAVNKNTVVVANAVGPIIVEPWIDHPNVTALVWAGLQGQEAGNAIADVLYGDVPPAGRLPYTIAKKPEDYSAQVIFQDQKPFLRIPYSEGLNIDYRHFDSANIAPRYEFGFGLSYTTFQYSGLHIVGGLGGSIPLPTGPGSSLNPLLHDKHFVTVSFTLRNTGKLAGTEVPQVYISLPASANSPPSLLKGFESIKLAPGQSKQVTIGLSRYDFSIWDVVQQKWVVPKGKAGIFVGSSSRNKKLVGSVNLLL